MRLAANMPHKGFVLEGLSISGIDDAEEYLLFGEAVEVFFDGGSFICGKDQEFKAGTRWTKAKDLLRKKLGSKVVYKVKDVGVKELHDYSVAETHSFRVSVGDNEFIAHNLPSIGGAISGGGTISTQTSSRWYKYFPITEVKTTTRIVRQRKKKEKVDVDLSRLVLLGGIFEQIGEQNEVAGGGSQKLGSSNK